MANRSDYRAYTGVWSAVVIQAFRDLNRDLTYKETGKIDKSKSQESPQVLRSRAMSWIMEVDPTYKKRVGSFHWVCSMLDLDEEWLRKQAMSREGIKRVLNGKLAFVGNV